MRLTSQIRPLRYQITLQLDPDQDEFRGQVTIHVEVLSEQPHLILHASDLEVEGATRVDAETIRVDGTLGAGQHQLTLSYQGHVNPRLRGLYRSVAPDGRKLLVTQGEPNYARLFFPCFDEPAFKAEFEIALEIPQGLTALSNAAEVSRQSLEIGLERVQFAPTPLMSSYLVALVVGHLEAAPALLVDNVRLQVWTTPGQSHLVEFATKVAAHSLKDYGRYFGCPYPLPKLDLIGVPDFGSGAMENLGAIIFRETNLLAREETSSQQVLHELALTVAHEVSHMWFGDLVTMEWWDDLWLNEAFATWMMVRAVDLLCPHWNCWDRFADSRQRAQEPDGLQSTRPIYANVDSPDQMAEMFDVITYNKGAAVIKMLEEFLGADVFQQGVAAYIQAHQFGNAQGADLWMALEKVSGKPVGSLMTSWLTQPGYPLLTAERQGSQLTFRQQRFLYSGTPSSTELWPVPLVYRVGEQTHRLILSQAEQTVEAPGPGPVLLNAGSFGYYRAQPNLPPLDPASLSVGERVNQVHDAWALVLNGHWSVPQFWQLAKAWCPQETTLNVWQAFVDAFTDLARIGSLGLAEKVCRLIPTGDLDSLEPLQARLLAARACLGNDASKLSWARQQLTHPEEPEAFEAALQVLGKHGDSDDYERVFQLWKAATEPNQERRLMLGLAAFGGPKLIERSLELTLDGSIRAADGGHLILALAKNPDAAPTLWTFVQQHWDRMVKVLPMQGMRLFVQGAAYLTLADQFSKIRQFLEERPVEGGRRQLGQSLERLQVLLDLRQREGTLQSTR